MFSKTITSSSQFLMMPESSQNLYFHLGMNADDDGFVEHFTVMRMVGAKPDDLKVLMARGFVHAFDDRVLVIMAWKENNYIQKDRYTPSKYLEVYKSELEQITSGCIQNVYKMETQVRLGKVRLGNTTSARDESFERFWKAYPKKKGKGNSMREWRKLAPSAELVEEIISHVERRKKTSWTKEGCRYVVYPERFLSGMRWTDELESENITSKTIRI